MINIGPQALALLRRKTDPNPVLPLVEPVLLAILAAMSRRIAAALAEA